MTRQPYERGATRPSDRPAAAVGAPRARCSRPDPCRRGSGAAASRGGSGCPAPCRSGPRRRARGEGASSSPPEPQRLCSAKPRSGASLEQRRHERGDLGARVSRRRRTSRRSQGGRRRRRGRAAASRASGCPSSSERRRRRSPRSCAPSPSRPRRAPPGGRARRAASRSRRPARPPRASRATCGRPPRRASTGERRKPPASRSSTRAALVERQPPELLAVPEQHVEDDELGRDLARQLADPALGRMEPRLHRVEVEAPSRAITISPSSAERGGRSSPSGAQLGEVAHQRPAVARPARARRRRSRARP